MNSMEQPREPKFYPNEHVLASHESSSKDASSEATKSETLQEMVERFNTSENNFICGEALKIYFRTQNEEIALKALKLLRKASQW